MIKLIKSLRSLSSSFFNSRTSGINDNVNQKLNIPNLERLPDDELITLNDLLPWASYVVDSKSRRFGKAFSSTKRTEAQINPDPRIVELNNRSPLADLTVLEVGCFEGIHTVALAEMARRVTAIDSRIENVVKTLVRCNMFGYKPDVFYLDLEEPLIEDTSLECDILHHVGVLYHLTNPVEHLKSICQKVNIGIMLDTHMASSNDTLKSYSVNGKEYSYKEYKEGGRSEPFSGMKNHAKWLLETDLVAILEDCGFKHIDIAERRDERNGARILMYAYR